MNVGSMVSHGGRLYIITDSGAVFEVIASSAGKLDVVRVFIEIK